MKQTLFSFFLICCMAIGDFKVKAQEVFAPVGAEWWYQGSNDHYIDWAGGSTNTTWSDHVQVTGDTIIQGVSSRIISVIRLYKNNLHGDSIVRSVTSYIYICDNTDTVFVYNSTIDGFTPLYLFTLGEKDTVCMPVPTSNEPLNIDFCFTVDSIKMEIFDGIPLKTWYTRSLDSFSGGALPVVNYGTFTLYPGIDPWVSVGRYTEKLGGTVPFRSSLFPSYTKSHFHVHAPIPIPAGNLVCYRDAAHSIKLVDYECDSIPTPRQTGITAIQALLGGIRIYPNPINQYFTLESNHILPAHLSTQIIDIAGRIYKLEEIGRSSYKREFRLENLPSGVYSIKMDVDQQIYYHKVLICK